MGLEKYGPYLPVTPQEEFVRGVYSLADEAAAAGLNRLRRENGIIPTCRLGCCFCCRFHILVNIAEAHTLARFLRREFSASQMKALQYRTLQWWEWDNSRPGRPRPFDMDIKTDLSSYEHCCPLLIDGACSAYSVRPMVCRTHYVTSRQQLCHAANDPKSTEAPPKVITPILEATSPFQTEIQKYIETRGTDYSRSIMLLPHHIAAEMGWDFAF